MMRVVFDGGVSGGIRMLAWNVPAIVSGARQRRQRRPSRTPVIRDSHETSMQSRGDPQAADLSPTELS